MKLSIITVNYNNKLGLEKTVASVMSQSWRDFEWILIDGGSTDGSKEVIETIANNSDSNITYWCSEKDKGIYNAMNKGITKAKGEYLNFMNSGDCYYQEDTLEKTCDNLKKFDIVYGDWLEIYSDYEEIRQFTHQRGIMDFYDNNICHQAMFIKASLLKGSLYDESYRLLADWKKWIDFALEGKTFQRVDIVICRYPMGGLSTALKDVANSEILRLQQSFPSLVQQTFDIIRSYECDSLYSRISYLTNKGGICGRITRSFIRLMYLISYRLTDKKLQ